MSRLQLALNVNDIEAGGRVLQQAVRHRTGQDPARLRQLRHRRPPLKLVLLENPGQGGTLNHLGIEVPDTDAVDAVQARLTGTGLASVDERDTTCCYARQDKFWVQGVPDGASWEVYTVLDDSQTFYSEDESGPGCCGGSEAEGSEPAEAGASAAKCC